MRSHKDLQVWQKAMQLANRIYDVTTGFPKEELFGLTSQMRRAAVSIPSNIAEGSARSSTKELAQFISISRGSLAELETQLLLCSHRKFLRQKDFEDIQNRVEEIGKMLTRLFQSLKH